MSFPRSLRAVLSPEELHVLKTASDELRVDPDDWSYVGEVVGILGFADGGVRVGEAGVMAAAQEVLMRWRIEISQREARGRDERERAAQRSIRPEATLEQLWRGRGRSLPI
jgi:hypothetical protein